MNGAVDVFTKPNKRNSREGLLDRTIQTFSKFWRLLRTFDGVDTRHRKFLSDES
ncbi:hypothetical protein BD410DRAFT_785269 [Rickenella mellea]|uniref:Uncharacterized protein n=1 Tax=Rickenella mellea TaxID=50990 RepID=A0A4Y7QCN1_9AGAM|nr:hypothetical protein BD410DRAFT_785269 [Rickenella mellea]